MDRWSAIARQLEATPVVPGRFEFDFFEFVIGAALLLGLTIAARSRPGRSLQFRRLALAKAVVDDSKPAA